jgi:hypothetical protein
MLRLPVVITSRRSRVTASMRSPPVTREFGHAEVSVFARVATNFGTAFIRAENGSSRPGHSRENSCQGAPQQHDPLIQRAAQPVLVAGDRLGAVPECPAASRRAP